MAGNSEIESKQRKTVLNKNNSNGEKKIPNNKLMKKLQCSDTMLETKEVLYFISRREDYKAYL